MEKLAQKDKSFSTKKMKKLIARNLPSLKLPLQEDYLIIETDGCEQGWGAVLIRKSHKYAPRDIEKIFRYSSGKFAKTGYISSIDAELLAIIYALDSFVLFLMNKKDFLIRTDCETIVKFYKNKDQKRSLQKRWVKFLTALFNRRFYPEIEHIKGHDNKMTDILSRLVYGETRYK